MAIEKSTDPDFYTKMIKEKDLPFVENNMPHPREPHYNAMQQAVRVHKKNLPYQRDARDAEALEIAKESNQHAKDANTLAVRAIIISVVAVGISIVVAIFKN